MIVKGWVHQVTVIIVNVFAPNIGVPKYIMQALTELKGEIDSSTTIWQYN